MQCLADICARLIGAFHYVRSLEIPHEHIGVRHEGGAETRAVPR
jgi:hypothetical protein